MASGTYHAPVEVKLADDQVDATIMYTLDGSIPTMDHGTLYEGPITIGEDTTLKAVAVNNGVLSHVVTYDYTIETITVAPPKANIDSGTYIAPIKVRLNTSLKDTTILYTLDGSTPTLGHGTLYDGPIAIDSNANLKAIVVSGQTVSDVVAFNYQINPDAQVDPLFTDTHAHWAQNEIKYIANIGLVGGYPDGTFGPNKNITRAEASSIIVREFALTGKVANFPDVSKSNWANLPIGAVTSAGIFGGYPDGDFKPGRSLTRAETAAILVRAFELQGKSSVQFSDVQGHWAAGDISKLVANGLTLGYPDGTFKPNQNVSRAEFVSMLSRILDR